MNSRKRFLKEAGVLLLAAVMILSSGAAIANTNNQKVSIGTTVNTSGNPNSSPVNRALVWDNVVGVHGADGGVIVAVVRPDGIAYPADDFELSTSQNVNSVLWQGGYFQCELAQGLIDYNWDWRILFWDDCGDGSHPGNEIHNWTIPSASINRELWYTWTNASNGRQYWVANYSADLPQIVTFNANTKYWITIQGIGAYPPQACWCRHNNSVGGIKLHEAVIKAELWGYPNWTNISVLVTDKLPHDLNYQLYGPSINNPPGLPNIDGTTSGTAGVTYTYNISSTDPDGDNVYYWIEWYDGCPGIEWQGPYPSGVPIQFDYNWQNQGTYIISVTAKDIFGAESDTATLTVIMPRIRNINTPIIQFLNNFLEDHPYLYLVLQKII